MWYVWGVRFQWSNLDKWPRVYSPTIQKPDHLKSILQKGPDFEWSHCTSSPYFDLLLLFHRYLRFRGSNGILLYKRFENCRKYFRVGLQKVQDKSWLHLGVPWLPVPPERGEQHTGALRTGSHIWLTHPWAITVSIHSSKQFFLQKAVGQKCTDMTLLCIQFEKIGRGLWRKLSEVRGSALLAEREGGVNT